ncbi:MAG TPA: hypothetical protein VFS23_26860 [Vicinamibacterales bacterium]|nr:hypothetical protein [Vicinamibacterales bacterium]
MKRPLTARRTNRLSLPALISPRFAAFFATFLFIAMVVVVCGAIEVPGETWRMPACPC